MKTIINLFFVLFYFTAHAQTWQTIGKLDTYETNPLFQFSINPYTNDIWMAGLGGGANNQLAVIENDGNMQIFPQTMSPVFLWGDDLCLTFTPSNVYYAHDNYGLYSFENYTPTMRYNFSSNSDKFTGISSNEDTVYVCFAPPGFDLNYSYKIYIPLTTFTTNHFAKKIISKKEFKYGVYSINTDLFYFTGLNNNDYNYIIGDPFGMNDPEYLGGNYHDVKFTRLSDTLFISNKLGISKVYNYDVFDTITPNNTVNMPSPNVLEMEWDMEDNLWAVFGDASDDPFAIAKLENDTWVNYFDANNSPINFSQFRGLEIDTLSNIWVADRDALHTLITPNSPNWLGVDKLDLDNSFEVYPNPSNGNITIATKELPIVSEIKVVDIMGRTVHEQSFQPKVNLELPSGNYFLQLKSEGQLLGVRKIVIQ